MLTLAVVLVIAYLLLCAGLFVFQRSLIYFPQPRWGGAGGTVIKLPVEGGDVLVSTEQRAGTEAVVYFGGNAEDVAYSLPTLSAAFANHAIYLMHYRGYGGSAGTPSEAALVADALALFDKVRAEHPSVTVIGRSLGSGVAVQLASQRPVARLVLVTPYDSVQNIAARQFFYVPVRWILRDKFESWKHAAQIAAPTLVIAAEHDEVIPRASTEALHGRFGKGIAAYKVLAGTNHNTVSDSPEYLPLLKGTQQP